MIPEPACPQIKINMIFSIPLFRFETHMDRKMDEKMNENISGIFDLIQQRQISCYEIKKSRIGVMTVNHLFYQFTDTQSRISPDNIKWYAVIPVFHRRFLDAPQLPRIIFIKNNIENISRRK